MFNPEKKKQWSFAILWQQHILKQLVQGHVYRCVVG